MAAASRVWSSAWKTQESGVPGRTLKRLKAFSHHLYIYETVWLNSISTLSVLSLKHPLSLKVGIEAPVKYWDHETHIFSFRNTPLKTLTIFEGPL